MSVVACCKWVAEGQGPVASPTGLCLGLDDRTAIAAASRIASALDMEVRALTCGDFKKTWSAKEALVRGADEVFWIALHEGQALDARCVATCLSAAIDAWDDVTAVVCADASEDCVGREIPARIAALLDMPLLTHVISFELRDGGVTVTRRLDGCREVVFASFPAVIAVLPDAAPAAIPGVMQIIQAAGKPITELPASLAGCHGSNGVVERLVPDSGSSRKRLVLDAADADSIGRFVLLLREEGVL